MGRDVSLDIRLRPLDTKRFVGDFVRKFSAWIPEGSSVRTTRDVLQCALADLDWLDHDFIFIRIFFSRKFDNFVVILFMFIMRC